LPASEPTRADYRFNFAACLTDAVGWPLSAAFFSQTTILPLLLHHLGASNTLVGALPALYNLLVFLPGLLVVGYLSRVRRARGFLFVVALVERFALLPLVFLTPLWGITHPQWLLVAVFVFITSHATAMGFNQPAYWAVIGKCVPAHWRGRLFGYAGGISGLLGIGVERLLNRLLSGPNGGFPGGYGLGFFIGFLIMTVSVLPLGVIREPVQETPPTNDPHSGHYGRDGLRVWRENTNFRRFLYGQIAFTLASLATPFFVLYAQRSLHAGTDSVAGYTGTVVLAMAFGGLGWGAWSDRAGNRRVLVASAACAIFSALFALVVTTPSAFILVFILTALATAGVNLAGNNIVMEYAPASRDIPLYTAIYNAVTALPRAAAPLIGGLLADSAGGYRLTFIFAAFLALIALFLSHRAGDPRKLGALREA